MSHSDKLKEQVMLLYGYLRLQKSLRLTFRAVWIGLVGVLVSWAIHRIWGYLPDPLTWVAIGLGLAFIPVLNIISLLIPVLASFPPPSRWIFDIDRRLEQHGQISTAWEIAHTKQSGPVADLLVDDMLLLLPAARVKILKDGWLPKYDLAAIGAAALIVLLMLAANLRQPPSQPASVPPAQAIPNTAPQQGHDQQALPQPEQLQNEPGAQPGASQDGEFGNSPAENPENSGPSEGEMEGGSSGENQGAVADSLRQLGEQLSQRAGTYDLGQALENLEMNDAADAMEDLSDQMDDLSPESRENMADALENAADNLEQSSPSMAEDMQNAASGLEEPEGSPEDAMGEVAEDLRELEGAMQALQDGGGGAGEGESPEAEQPEQADRLPNEGGQMEIPLEDTDQSDLLSPADPGADAEGTASGSMNANRPQPGMSNQSPLLPSSFLWKWRDVVSEYFQREK